MYLSFNFLILRTMKEIKGFIPYEFTRLLDDDMRDRARRFYSLMKNRRSIRMFSQDPVPDNVIEYAIRTAGSAPSGANKQPWFFCVIKNADVKRKIRIAAEEEERRNYGERFTEEWLRDLEPIGTDAEKPYLEHVPVLIVVFKENYRIENGVKKKNYYVNESVGIAIGILLTALHHAGVATLTHTPNPMKFLNDILNRPVNEVPVVILPVGYPADNCMVPDLPRKQLEQIMKIY